MPRFGTTASGRLHRRPLRSPVIAPLALALGALLLAGCDDGKAKTAAAPPPLPVTVAKPVVKEIVEWDEFTGRFDAVAAVELRARVGGYLDSIHFTDGAVVKSGDLLFIIDPRPYQAALAQAEATVTNARTKLERAERLVRTGSATEQTLDQRRQQFQSSQAEVNGARAALDQSKLDLGYTEIRAPMAGRISRKLVTEGNLVSANTTILTTIVSLDPIYFYFDVDERSFLAYARMFGGQVGPGGAKGQEVEIQLTDERAPQHKGHIDFTDNRVDQAAGTMRLRAVLENKSLLLTPGLFGRIRIPGSERYKAVLIPEEAIGADLDRRVVYVVGADQTIAAKVIRPGPRIDGYRVVRTGLTGDETIVIAGVQRIRLGKVAPKLVELPPSR